MRLDRITVYRDRAGRWRWRRVAPNGEVVGAAHQSYATAALATENVERTQGGRYDLGDDR